MQSLRNIYRYQIVPEACNNQDFMGDWWDVRIQHAISIVVVNVLTVVSVSYLSFKLFKVYANESFSRVGASPKVNRMYKLFLFFSVCLQLTGFFSLASTALWLNKVCHAAILRLTSYPNVYKAVVIVKLVLYIPWLIMGLTSIRSESKIRFGVFAFISIFLLSLLTVFFFSPIYRYVFTSWPFFASVTVTAYVLVIASSVLGVLCRLNFGKGLAHYLQVTEALAGVDFTAVQFPKGHDVERKGDLHSSDFQTSRAELVIQIPALTYTPKQSTNSSHDSGNSNSNRHPKVKKQRWSSICSELYGTPILLSSSTPLVSELGPVPVGLGRLSNAGQSQRGLAKMPVLVPVQGSDNGVQVKGTAMPPSPPPSSKVAGAGLPGLEDAMAPSSPILFNQPASSSSSPPC